MTDENQLIKSIIQEAEKEIYDIKTDHKLNLFKSKYLNKNSELYQLQKGLKNKTIEEKKILGTLIHDARSKIEILIEKQKNIVLAEFYNTPRESDEVINNGHQNPLLKIKNEIEEYFAMLGYEIVDGHEVESDEYNFARLNLPKDHPARDMQDTFYLKGYNNYLLRTHTSNMQARMLESNVNQEIKMVSSGKVYRRDDDDSTHSHQFMQIDGFYVTKKNNSNPADLSMLIKTLQNFINYFFGDDREIRLRPSFFPFTAPSYELDMTCHCSKNNDCPVCKGEGFIELLGCGIIHPHVLKSAGYDEEAFQGFAFGIGIERIAMLKLEINDIRQFYLSKIDDFKKYS